ncbi:DeoR family transcriptional regulator [Entomoplasma ellychniae]|uniref:DeoR family transcriptional regulator n=1 Tax=Entomoplasma ellychniae TaxID=2114 RepID=A0A8E2QWI3_9MOLU|nr:DeoR/GlpR family DNA-binding transcription regulator [Entomoplasma ellychniae]PPE04972.1 DeoR family transcriptional regulator [Entomoplasma ellychniae]
MIKFERKKLIIDFLKEKGISYNEVLSEKLNIPMSTLRRDLNELLKEGLINKMHGGVEYNDSSLVMEDFFESKLNNNVDEKILIAKKAIKLIKKNESIFIDSGSNGFYVCKFLPKDLNLKIVTNSVYNVLELMKQGHQKVYLLGGKFKPVTGAIIGYEAIQSIANYSFDKAFIGINAIDDQFNLYTTNSEHAQVKIEIIKCSKQTYGLADSSKFNKKSFYLFAREDKVNLIRK